MKKLIWSTQWRKVNDLLPFSKNPRSITTTQMRALRESLKKFNLVELPAIDVDGKICTGHQRIKALQFLGRGEDMIEVRIPNRPLTKEEYERYMISSNAISGDWDFEKLKSFDLDTLLEVGFDKSELEDMWAETLEVEDDNFDEAVELKKIKTTDIKPGDVFSLGKHKLICANALDQNTPKRLMGNVRVDMVNDDLPFNIGLSYQKGVGNKGNYGGTTNDKKTDEEYKTFVKTVMQNALSVSKPDCHFMFWCDERYVWLFQILYKELGIDSKRLLIWLKNNSSPTPTVAFNKATEFCVYGTRGHAYLSKSVNNLNEIVNKKITTGNNVHEEISDLFNVWMIKRLPSKEYDHPTQKNPTLHEKSLRRCTRPSDAVLDLTAGSGSILSACEQLGRVAYLCEYEPVFCQLIINRFQRLTGKKAKLIRHYEEK